MYHDKIRILFEGPESKDDGIFNVAYFESKNFEMKMAKVFKFLPGIFFNFNFGSESRFLPKKNQLLFEKNIQEYFPILVQKPSIFKLLSFWS